MCKTKTMQEIIFDIHKRKNEYLFGNSIDNSQCSYNNEDCQECSYSKPDDCPFFKRENEKINPLRFVQCYVNNNRGFIKYLDENDFIVMAPLFRIHQIKDGVIDYLDHYWYPFRRSAYVDISIRTSELNLSIDFDDLKKQKLEKLRWDITTQRNINKNDDNNIFSLFKKVQETKYYKDQTFKYIDVCDGYASFMMLYFVIVKRREALGKWRAKKEKEIKNNFLHAIKGFKNQEQKTFINGLLQKEYKKDFENELSWELIELNDQLKSYIDNNNNNILNLSIDKPKGGIQKRIVYRTSTWKQDLQLIGLKDRDGSYTKKMDWFITWLYKDDKHSDKNIIVYKKLLKKIIENNTKNLILNYNNLKEVDILYDKNKFKFDRDEKENFTLFPPMHIIVRAFWTIPVRWFFIPMTPVIKENSQKTLSTSGIILMLKDDKVTTAYSPEKTKHKIIDKVKNLLPLLTSIYAIEKQSLEDHINSERIKIHKEQKTTALSSAIAKVFLRTLTHNIGSHVLNKISETANLDLEPLLELTQKDEHSQTLENEQYKGLYINGGSETITVHQEIKTRVKEKLEENGN